MSDFIYTKTFGISYGMKTSPFKDLARLILIWLVFFFNQVWCPAQSDQVDLTDSLLLLKNILKDLGKEKKVEEQYRLFIRAESIYKRIKESFSVNETKDLKKQLAIQFRRLPAPKKVTASKGLLLTLKGSDSSLFYWSDPITEGMFVGYLNSVRLPVSDMNRHVTRHSHSITFDENLAKYQSQNPDKALLGANYLIAKEFIEWWSQDTKYRFMLPNEAMVLASGEEQPSCWTRTIWKEKDSIRNDAWEMFGAEFFTFFINGNRSGELPESCYAEIQVRLTTRASTGKKLYLKKLRSEK